ncbi:MAG: tRNA adenosine(34) deaminase TadA [Thermoguttaceae bacterium]|nr:tRNA adenosine(34) deaminase TadA [Thermoguttaceae bacterium]
MTGYFSENEPLPGRDAWAETWNHQSRDWHAQDADDYYESNKGDDVGADSQAWNDSEQLDEFQVDRSPERWMREAIHEAQLAESEGEVPIGAVIVRDGRIIARAHNQREQLQDPTAHAETIAITQAASVVGSWRLERCALYVTLEPCAMCAGAILLARIPLVFYGARDPKAGAVDTLYRLLDDVRLNHRAKTTGGVLADPCGAILTDFFRKQRKLGKK